MISKLTGYILG